MRPFRDLTGMKFHRWTVNKHAGRVFSPCGTATQIWHCTCDCGAEKIVRGPSLTAGNSKSCGCWNLEVLRNRAVTHGMSKTRTYESYLGMIKRCYDPEHNRFPRYGGRGIKVCDRWLESFENFLEDMGECPSAMSLDRVDNDGDYCPQNCKWSSATEQARNRVSNRTLEYGGMSKTVAEWGEYTGLGWSTLNGRLQNGWNVEDTLTRPKRLTGRAVPPKFPNPLTVAQVKGHT